MDAALEYRDIVPLADLRHALEDRGLYCQSLWLTADNLNTVIDAMSDQGGGSLGILALPTTSPNLFHFVVLEDGHDGEITVFDTRDHGPKSFRLSDLKLTRLPVLLVSVHPSIKTMLEGESFSFGRFVTDVATSWVISCSIAIALLSWAMSERLKLYRRNVAVACEHIWQSGRLWIVGIASRKGFLSMGLLALAIGIGYQIYIEAAPLEVEFKAIDLGLQPIGSNKTTAFRVFNRSFHRSHELRSVEGSCSCLSLRVKGAKIPPRGAARIELSYLIQTEGKAEHAVLVSPSDEQPKMAVKVSYVGYESAKLVPPYLNIGAFPLGLQDTKQISLKVNGYQGKSMPLQISEESMHPDWLRVSVVKPGLLVNNQEINLEITCTGQRPFGAFSEKVVLSTAEETPRTFVIVVHGEIAAPIDIQPTALFINTTGNGKNGDSLWIRSRSGPLKLRSVSSDTELIKLKVDCPAGSDECHIQVLPVDAQSASGMIDIVTESPVVHHFEIPVYLGSRLQ